MRTLNRKRHLFSTTAIPNFETIQSAALKLGIRPAALRSRCLRAAIQAARTATYDIGGGLAAARFGRSWRIWFQA